MKRVFLLLCLLLPACSSLDPSSQAASLPILHSGAEVPEARQTASQEWQGIPIMPEARYGRLDDRGYTYIIHTTPQIIQDYYELTLKDKGMSLWAFGQVGEGEPAILFFQGEGGTARISINSKGGYCVVTIAR